MAAHGTARTAPPAIAVAEYQARIARTQEDMAEERLDALLLTSEDNYRYLTGFDAPVWQNLTRPRYLVVPAAGPPILVVPAGNIVITERTTPWITDVRTWVAPDPVDDGVSLVVDALKAAAGPFGRIGAELGPESRLTMPVGDFLRIREGIAPAEVADGDAMLRRLRMVKSPAEIALMRYVSQLVSDAFEDLPDRLAVGDTERVAAARFQADVLAGGGEKIQYLVCTSGRNGYPCINLGPSDHALERGDVLIIDTGVSYAGYYCDFDRDYAFGPPCDEVRRAYDAVWRATEAGIAAAQPGATTTDVWRAQAEVIAEANGVPLTKEGFGAGRFGHGVGLRMCEPPSNSPDDETVLTPNMTLTIEPGIPFTAHGRDGPERKILVHEENMVVTEDGADLLTRRAPPEIPVIG
jgi:Xaa-Pro aminopeptidase